MAGLAHRAVLATLKPPYRLLWRVLAEERARVPDAGAVFVFNHPRNRDPVDLQVAWGRPVYFLGKKEAFEWPVLGWIFRNVGGQIPLDRQAGGNLEALREAVAHLRRGEKIAIAPEGTKSHDGPLGRGRSGAVRMAWAAQVPIVPVAIRHGIFATWVRFGWPIDLREFGADPDDAAAVRAGTDEMMRVLARMLGEPYDPATAPDYARDAGFAPSGGRPRPDEDGPGRPGGPEGAQKGRHH